MTILEKNLLRRRKVKRRKVDSVPNKRGKGLIRWREEPVRSLILAGAAFVIACSEDHQQAKGYAIRDRKVKVAGAFLTSSHTLLTTYPFEFFATQRKDSIHNIDQEIGNLFRNRGRTGPPRVMLSQKVGDPNNGLSESEFQDVQYLATRVKNNYPLLEQKIKAAIDYAKKIHLPL